MPSNLATSRMILFAAPLASLLVVLGIAFTMFGSSGGGGAGDKVFARWGSYENSCTMNTTSGWKSSVDFSTAVYDGGGHNMGSKFYTNTKWYKFMCSGKTNVYCSPSISVDGNWDRICEDVGTSKPSTTSNNHYPFTSCNGTLRFGIYSC